MNKTELLVPAGDLARCKVAIDYGADAVYIGGQSYSLRYRASNFSFTDIKEAVEYAHLRNKKIYVTVNMIFHDDDLVGIKEYLIKLNELKVDAIIVASPYILELRNELKLDYEVHMSTQLSLLNSLDIAFYEKLGAKRVILGRELSIPAIRTIKEKSSVALEVFIHGALCANYSGRCTLSNEMTGRDANRGGCAHSCRWKYYLYGDDEVVSPEDKLFTLSCKDLCGLDYIGDLIDAKVDSFKIEGRMKSAYYLATLTKTYREFIDLYHKDPIQAVKEKERFRLELSKAENRMTSAGFLKEPDHHDILYGVNGSGVTHEYVAYVLSYDELKQIAKVQVRNVINKGDILEVLSPKTDSRERRFAVEQMTDDEGDMIDYANKPMMVIEIPLSFPVLKGDFLRKVKEDDI